MPESLIRKLFKRSFGVEEERRKINYVNLRVYLLKGSRLMEIIRYAKKP